LAQGCANATPHSAAREQEKTTLFACDGGNGAGAPFSAHKKKRRLGEQAALALASVPTRDRLGGPVMRSS
jgi:hypothetical protein